MNALSASIAQADLVMTPRHMRDIQDIAKSHAGITLDDNSQKLVISRLSRHIRRLGFHDFGQYLKAVTGPEGAEELSTMIDALTTNTTRFFREAEHFRILEDVAMPRLIARARAGGRVRLWSAACSTGEEAYSIAATLLGAFPDAADFDVKILATDISHSALSRAKPGVYDRSSAEGLSDDRRNALFDPKPSDDGLKVRASVQTLVTFRYLNFVDPWPVSGPFDVIFCRNVAIYMDRDIQLHLWKGLERVLAEDGLLFIGHSERMAPCLSHCLELFGPTAFRRPGQGRYPASATEEPLHAAS